MLLHEALFGFNVILSQFCSEVAVDLKAELRRLKTALPEANVAPTELSFSSSSESDSENELPIAPSEAKSSLVGEVRNNALALMELADSRLAERNQGSNQNSILSCLLS